MREPCFCAACCCLSLASLQVWPSPAATQCLSALRLRYSADHGWLTSWSSPLELQVAGCCAWPAGTEALVLVVAGGQKRAQTRRKSASAVVTAPTNACFLPLLCVLVLVCAGRFHRSCQQQLGVVICAVNCSHVCARSRQEMSQESADSIERCWLGQHQRLDPGEGLGGAWGLGLRWGWGAAGRRRRAAAWRRSPSSAARDGLGCPSNIFNYKKCKIHTHSVI